ncbi:MAG TPA: DUF1003 domain-containing protein [Candidatus Saccharimonadales bacterium]|nr:DUF1003 domain-containing protein [Candidatus Saccharimonadales bacterium]
MDIQQPQPEHPPGFGRRRRVIKSLKAQADARRSPAERFADWLTDYFGTVGFLTMNAVWFMFWIVINMGWVPGVQPFDPFPFGLLTMVVSLEAIFLAIIVLISQNRAAKIADLREEIDLQINTMAEEEVTKMIQLQLKLLEKNGVILEADPDLERMLRPLHSADIAHSLENQLNGAHKSH